MNMNDQFINFYRFEICCVDLMYLCQKTMVIIICSIVGVWMLLLRGMISSFYLYNHFILFATQLAKRNTRALEKEIFDIYYILSLL